MLRPHSARCQRISVAPIQSTIQQQEEKTRNQINSSWNSSSKQRVFILNYNRCGTVMLLLLLIASCFSFLTSSHAATSSSRTTSISRATPRHRSSLSTRPQRASDGVSDVELTIQQVVIAPPASSSSSSAALLSFEVALITVHLSRHFESKRDIRWKKGEHERRERKRNKEKRKKKDEQGVDSDIRDASINDELYSFTSDFSTSDLFPEEYEAHAEGLTRLVCGPDSTKGDAAEEHHRVFESFPVNAEEDDQMSNKKKRHISQHLRQHAAKYRHDNANESSDPPSPAAASLHPDIYLLPLDSLMSHFGKAAAKEAQKGSVTSDTTTAAAHEQDYIHPLHSMLHTMYGSSPQLSGAKLTYALVLSMEWIHENDEEDEDTDMSSPTILSIPSHELSSCSLHFLPASHQLLLPAGHYVDSLGHVLRGSVKLVSDEQEQHPHYAAAATEVASDQLDVLKIVDLARQMIGVEGSDSTTIGNGDDEDDDDLEAHELHTLLRTPSSSSSSSSSDTSFLSLSSSFTTSAHMRKFGELAVSLTKGMVSGMAAPASTALTGAIFDQTKKNLMLTLSGSLGNEVSTQFSRALIIPTTQEIVAEVDEKILADYPKMLSKALTPKVDKAVTKTLTTKITDMLVKRLARSGHDHIGVSLVHDTMPELLLPLSHTLTKSLSHTLTSTLLHTMDSSPQMDYYCYFCAKKKLYCEYCTYAPKQLYYSQYYAGYFSTFYANYYSRYTTDEYMRGEGGKGGFIHQPQALSLAKDGGDDGVELVIGADETISTWKEEERRKGTLHFYPTLRPQDKA